MIPSEAEQAVPPPPPPPQQQSTSPQISSTSPIIAAALDKDKDKATREKRRKVSRDRPTSFFIKSEGEVEQALAESARSPPQDTSGSFGVESLAHAVSTANKMDEAVEEEAGTASPNRSPRKPITRPASVNTISLPLTPAMAHSPSSAPLSTPRSTSLRSFKLSDDESAPDDAGSQAVASSGEEDEEEEDEAQSRASVAHEALLHSDIQHQEHLHLGAEGVGSDSVQLVMPSINMPSRRPFTDKGRQMGKLKVLVVGPKSVGKTSLIRSIVQTCEHIVHIDPLTPSLPTLATTSERRRSSQYRRELAQQSKLAEINASTRAYPSWWSDLDDSRVLRRRKSSGDFVLERNLTFIDTPGFDESSSSGTAAFDVVLNYVETLLHRNASTSGLSDSELMAVMSGNGGVQVDLAVYVCAGAPSEQDKRYVDRLSTLTNVLPVIGRSDTLTAEKLTELKAAVGEALKSSNDTRPLFPSNLASSQEAYTSSTPVFAISSQVSLDDDMDASLMMSPDYVQPLVDSDLPLLVAQVFDPETAAYLRHTAARKFVAWRAANRAILYPPSTSPETIRLAKNPPSATSSAYTTSSIIATSVSPSAVLVSNSRANHSPDLDSYQLAHLSDHTQREQRLAQVRLARWATDLQRALTNERSRYAALQDAERRAWLEARMAEVVSAGHEPEKSLAVSRPSFGSQSSRHNVDHSLIQSKPLLDPLDPLGLVAWDDAMRRRGLLLVKLLAGTGVVGAVFVWVWRSWAGEASLFDGSTGGGGRSWSAAGWWKEAV